MLKSLSSLLCGLFVLLTLYVLLTLSGCSIMMAMVGDKEPDFEHIKVEATKEEIAFVVQPARNAEGSQRMEN